MQSGNNTARRMTVAVLILRLARRGRNVRYQIRLNNLKKRLFNKNPRGVVFIEYLLLVTLVGFGVIVGLATLRSALVNELLDLANAINAINT